MKGFTADPRKPLEDFEPLEDRPGPKLTDVLTFLKSADPNGGEPISKAPLISKELANQLKKK